MGWFGGSNALWRTDELKAGRPHGPWFATDVQTEDIDLSARMLLDNHLIVIHPDARSGESGWRKRRGGKSLV